MRTPSAATADERAWTPERLTLASSLAMTASVAAYFIVPVTENLSIGIGLVVVLCTTLVAHAFWRRSRRVRGLGRTIGYCFVGGALAGVVNIWLCVCVLTLWSGGESLRYLDPRLCVWLTLAGAVLGIAVGIACVVPMLTQ